MHLATSHALKTANRACILPIKGGKGGSCRVPRDELVQQLPREEVKGTFAMNWDSLSTRLASDGPQLDA